MTQDLTTTKTKIVFWILVAICGLLGGLAADLVKTRKVRGENVEGAVERVSRPSKQLIDLGTPAAMVVGAVAAAVAVWIFDIVQTKTTAGTSSDNYNIVQLVGVCLIAGFSGPKFLQTAAERTLALVDAQHLETALRATGQANDAGAQQAAAAGGGGGGQAVPAQAVQQHAAVVGAIVSDALAGKAPHA